MKSMLFKSGTAALAIVALMALVAAPAFAAPTQVPFNATFAGSLAFTGSTTAVYSGPGVGTIVGAGELDGAIEIVGPAPSCDAANGFAVVQQDTDPGAGNVIEHVVAQGLRVAGCGEFKDHLDDSRLVASQSANRLWRHDPTSRPL